MELYLDSVDFKEIEEALGLGTIAGVSTTPIFMHRHGISDVNAAIVKLSQMVPVLQLEVLGETPQDILGEAERILALGLEKEKTVFKIPVSNVGIQACRLLRSKGYLVNIHMVYTLNQAYMAMSAGATYVCPLVGRLQDQGHDALALIEQCVQVVAQYDYPTKVMFASVRHAEHVRTALLSGVHTITAPWGVIRKLTENNFAKSGSELQMEHSKQLSVKVRDIIKKQNPVCLVNETMFDAVIKMTDSKLGAVSILDERSNLIGIFTDSDVRRHLKESGKSLLDRKMGDFTYAEPITINADAMLYEAVSIFTRNNVDNIIVMENNRPYGILDIQDFVKMGLVG